MRFFAWGGAVLALALASGVLSVSAVAADAPKATDLIFETKHLAKLEKGTLIG